MTHVSTGPILMARQPAEFVGPAQAPRGCEPNLPPDPILDADVWRRNGACTSSTLLPSHRFRGVQKLYCTPREPLSVIEPRASQRDSTEYRRPIDQPTVSRRTSKDRSLLSVRELASATHELAGVTPCPTRAERGCTPRSRPGGELSAVHSTVHASWRTARGPQSPAASSDDQPVAPQRPFRLCMTLSSHHRCNLAERRRFGKIHLTP